MSLTKDGVNFPADESQTQLVELDPIRITKLWAVYSSWQYKYHEKKYNKLLWCLRIHLQSWMRLHHAKLGST